MNLQAVKVSFLKSLKTLTIAFVCSLVIFANAVPALAIGAPKSSAVDNTAQLSDIERESQEAAQSGLLSGEEVKDKANQGINEIQGAADADKMKNPSNSQGAVTVSDEIKNALEKVTGKG
jgi:hypothetical protein